MIRRLGILLMSACCVAGCDIAFGNSTEGDHGELEFTYAGDALFDCLFGCSLDAPILVGATATVGISDDRPDESFTVRVPSWVKYDYQESFECTRELPDGSVTSRSIDRGEACERGETRDAMRFVSLTPSAEGTFTLEILRDGEELDSVDIEAREVQSFLVRDEQTSTLRDRLALAPGASATITAAFYDADGRELYYDGIDGGWITDDESVVTVENDFNWGLGDSAEGQVTAESAGTTTLRFVGNDGEWGSIPVVVH